MTSMLDAQATKSVEELMERLRPFVARRLTSPADVDDVLQEVFLRMQRHLGELRDSDRFGPWLYRIVRNAIADRFRVQSREAGPPDESSIPADDDHEDDNVESLATCVAPMVARLPSPYREAVTLVDIEGVTFKDAAAMLAISIPGAKSRVQRGRSKLRDLFEECCRLEFDARRRVVAYQCRSGKWPCGSP
jgi:RNA polymerase sigma-70 factor (ECF subfamily)